MKKVIGEVTQEENREIQKLYERYNSLRELSIIVDASNGNLYEKLMIDLAETQSMYQSWWSRMKNKYKWEGTDLEQYEINFDTSEIFQLDK